MRETLSQVRTWASSPSADIALATALAAYAMLEIWRPDSVGVEAGGDKAILVTTMLAATVPLALRRRAPLAVLAVVVAALTAQALLTVFLEGLAGIAALLVAVYSVAAHAGATRALAGLAVALAGAAAIGESASDGAFNALLVAGTWIAGRALRTARVRTSELEALAAQLEREREERARLAVAEERARIARELHDVVAHGVSTMVVQAEAGEALLDKHPERARESLTAIQSTGREALGEMRRLLGLLRRGDVEVALAPQPGLAELGRLAEQVTQAGLPVELEVLGEPRSVPAGLDLSAYRIVQEALTNALTHAGPARARVTVRYGEREVELEIADDGHGDSGESGGHGLSGMRERVRLVGGELWSGRGAAGGFVVRARLPLEA
jgi:signal transduction histidine kinase